MAQQNRRARIDHSPANDQGAPDFLVERLASRELEVRGEVSKYIGSGFGLTVRWSHSAGGRGRAGEMQSEKVSRLTIEGDGSGFQYSAHSDKGAEFEVTDVTALHALAALLTELASNVEYDDRALIHFEACGIGERPGRPGVRRA